VYFVHDEQGGVDGYRELASMFPSTMRVWGLRPGELARNSKIRDLTIWFADRILDSAGEGPVVVLGRDGGGVLAFETAAELESRGHAPLCVIVLDSTATRSVSKSTSVTRKYTGTVILLKATGAGSGDTYLGSHDDRPAQLSCVDPELGWGSLTKRIRVINVPGGHRTMLARPHVVSLAKLLSPYLDEISDQPHLPRVRRVLDASVCVVIVNYGTPELCLDCLRSLEPERRSIPGLRVHLVDNCSGDHSVDVLRTGIHANHWSDWVVLLPQNQNGGFASGNNAGIRPALSLENPPKYFHLLNPDTIVRKDGVYQLVDYLECNPEVGIAASSLEDLEGNRRVVSFRFPSILSEFDSGLRLGFVSRLLEPYLVSPAQRPTDPCPTDWASGASLMVRRETLMRIGLMDEGFFLYFEETDFLRRAARSGWPCHYVPKSRIVHLIGQSTGLGGNSMVKRRPAYWFESRRRYFSKHYGKLYAAAADLAFVAGRSLYEARRRISSLPVRDPPYLLKDFITHSVLVNWWRCEP